MTQSQQASPRPTSDSSGPTAVNDPYSSQSSQERKECSDCASNISSAIPTFPHGALPGWPELAEVMAKTPDFAAFPRFRDLNVKSLLYYQVELTKLRRKLHDQEYEDNGKPSDDELFPDAADFAERADFLVENQNSPQFMIIKEIRRLLKEYNKALLLYSQISALPDPDTYNIHSLKRWLRHPELGAWHIRGDGDDSWGDLHEVDKTEPLWTQFWHLLLALIWPQPPPRNDLDLVATRPQGRVDGLTRWVVWKLIPFWAEINARKKHPKKQSDLEKGVGAAFSSSYWPRRRLQKGRDGPAPNGKLQIKKAEKWRSETTKQETIQIWSEKARCDSPQEFR